MVCDAIMAGCLQNQTKATDIEWLWLLKENQIVNESGIHKWIMRSVGSSPYSKPYEI
jgi:hypothetical protein